MGFPGPTPLGVVVGVLVPAWLVAGHGNRLVDTRYEANKDAYAAT